MSKLFVGIDVSKDSFSASGLDVKGNVSFSLSAAMDKSGFSELMKAIASHCKDISAVMATAHKLIRTIFAMLSHKSFFRVKENSL